MSRIAGVLGAVALAVLMVGSRIGMAATPCCGHRDCKEQIQFCASQPGATHHGCAVGIIEHCKTGICGCTGVAGCLTTDVICSSPSGAFLDGIE